MTQKMSTAPLDTHFPGSLSYMAKPHAAAICMEIEDPEVEFISPTRVGKGYVPL